MTDCPKLAVCPNIPDFTLTELNMHVDEQSDRNIMKMRDWGLGQEGIGLNHRVTYGSMCAHSNTINTKGLTGIPTDDYPLMRQSQQKSSAFSSAQIFK